MLLPEVVNVRQDGPVIPVHRTWTSVRRESERVIQVYIRSVSTTRVHLTVNVIMVGRILQTVTVSNGLNVLKCDVLRAVQNNL